MFYLFINGKKPIFTLFLSFIFIVLQVYFLLCINNGHFMQFKRNLESMKHSQYHIREGGGSGKSAVSETGT